MTKLTLDTKIHLLMDDIYRECTELLRLEDQDRGFYDYLLDDANEHFNKIIEENVLPNHPITKEKSNYKDLIILALTSTFYEITNLKLNMGFDIGDVQDVYDMLDEKDYSMSEIVNLFKDKMYEDYGQLIVEELSSSISNSELYTKRSILLLKEQGKISKMLKMNGMLLSSYNDALKNKYFVKQYIIEEVVDIYNYVCNEICTNLYNDGYEEETIALAMDENIISDELDDYSKNLFSETIMDFKNEVRERIINRYGDNAKEIYGIIAGITYESIVCSYYLDNLDLTQAEINFTSLMENNQSNLDYIYDYICNDDFTNSFVLSRFMISNEYTDKNTLLTRQEYIEKNGYSKILKKYIHCYDKEI